MQLERRRVLRRAAAGGVALAALSMIPLCVMEIAYTLLVHKPIFGTYGEGLRFSLYLVLLLVCGGAVLGALEGLLTLGISTTTQLLAKKRVAEPRWMAWLYSLLALPLIAVFSAMVFGGRRAQQIPGKHYLALGLGLLALVGTYLFIRLIIGVRDRFRIRRWGPRQAALLAPAMLAMAAALYVLDQTVLVRLYAFFHVGLTLGTVGFCQLAAGVVYMAHRPRSRWMGRLAEPSVALLLFIAGVAGVTWSLNRINRWETLRSIYYQHTVVQSKLLILASKIKVVQGAEGLLLPTRPAEPLPQSPLRAGPHRSDANLVLISVDALRGDHMGIYGYNRPTTPNLDRWARNSVVFERGYCQVPHTSFSVTSLLTGTYVYSVSRANPGKRFRTVAEALRRYGYKTAGFFPPAVFYIDRNNFTAFERSLFGFEYVKYEYLAADQRVDQVLQFLKENDKSRFFIWIHLFELHEPYERHPGFDFGPRAMDRYHSELAFVDHHLGRLLAHLKQHLPNTIVALTADHGEEFGEHGGHYHGNALFDQQVRVPLIIGVPGLAPRRVDGAAQVIDLPVTLLSLADVPVSAGMRGTDLGPWLVGEDPALLPPVFSEMEQQKMVVYHGHKLLCDTARGFCELFDLVHDPMERRNLIAQKPALAADLRRRLTSWMASHSAPREDEEMSEVATLLDRGRQGDMGAVPGLVGLVHGPTETRREAIQFLTALRAPGARDALIKASGDSDPGVAIQATIGAALLGDPQSLTRLGPLLGRPDLPPSLRRDAMLALARSEDRSVTLDLGRYLDAAKGIYERIEIIEAMGQLKDPRTTGPLLRQMQTLRTKLAAIDALGLIRATTAVPTLIQILQTERFVSWRRAAARALGRIGDRRAVGALQHAVHTDLEADVVADAVEALELLKTSPAGLIPLTPRTWVCQAARCTLDLAADCSRLRGPNDLIMRFGGTKPPVTVDLLCGTQRASGFEVGERGIVVLLLPRAGDGTLQLRMNGDARPVLHQAWLRRVP